MDDKEERLYDIKTIKDWDSLYNLYIKKFTDEKEEWVFRGESSGFTDDDYSHIPEDAFKSRLYEDFLRFEIKEDDRRRDKEQRLIRAFRRKAPLHTKDKSENWLECLALIQHYEGPTRMLDWTYSFFAAVYFAINRAKKNKDGRIQRVVWALDSKWLGVKCKKFEAEYIEKHEDDKETKRKLENAREDNRGQLENRVIHSFITKRLTNSTEPYEFEPMVYSVNPYYLNERLSYQRGVLICPSQIDISWGENLQSMLQKSQQEGDTEFRLWRIKIDCDAVEVQKKFLRRLFDMNISQASLFPDLEGLAKSLRIMVSMLPFIKIDT